MAIYDVEVFHVGSTLSYTTDPVQIIYESKEEDTAADLVNIAFSILYIYIFCYLNFFEDISPLWGH